MRDEELKSVDEGFFLPTQLVKKVENELQDTLNWEGGVGTLPRMRILDIPLGDMFQLSFCCHPINPFATQLSIILCVHVVEFF